MTVDINLDHLVKGTFVLFLHVFLFGLLSLTVLVGRKSLNAADV